MYDAPRAKGAAASMKPLVYVAIAPELIQELSLEEQLPRLANAADVERWPGPGSPLNSARGAWSGNRIASKLSFSLPARASPSSSD